MLAVESFLSLLVLILGFNFDDKLEKHKEKSEGNRQVNTEDFSTRLRTVLTIGELEHFKTSIFSGHVQRSPSLIQHVF